MYISCYAVYCSRKWLHFYMRKVIHFSHNNDTVLNLMACYEFSSKRGRRRFLIKRGPGPRLRNHVFNPQSLVLGYLRDNIIILKRQDIYYLFICHIISVGLLYFNVLVYMPGQTGMLYSSIQEYIEELFCMLTVFVCLGCRKLSSDTPILHNIDIKPLPLVEFSFDMLCVPRRPITVGLICVQVHAGNVLVVYSYSYLISTPTIYTDTYRHEGPTRPSPQTQIALGLVGMALNQVEFGQGIMRAFSNSPDVVYW